MIRHMGLRERKKEEMRSRIVQAAVELFIEQGYDATTIDDIVAKANYSRSTFFRHFGSKEDVIFGDLSDRLVGVIEELRSRVGPGVDPWESAREAFTRHTLQELPLAPALAAECVALWFSVPALQRRYAEVALNSELLLAEFFAERWGADPDTCIEAQVVSAAILSVARATLKARLCDDHNVVELLDRGFNLIESGFAGMRLPAPHRRK